MNVDLTSYIIYGFVNGAFLVLNVKFPARFSGKTK